MASTCRFSTSGFAVHYITYRYMYLINIFGDPLIQNLCGSRFARLPMGGTRSISEDSVFKPEQKEGGLDPLRQTAISMEQVNQQFKVRGLGSVYG